MISGKIIVQQKGWTWQNVADPSGKNDFSEGLQRLEPAGPVFTCSVKTIKSCVKRIPYHGVW